MLADLISPEAPLSLACLCGGVVCVLNMAFSLCMGIPCLSPSSCNNTISIGLEPHPHDFT